MSGTGQPIWVGCNPGNFMVGRRGFTPQAIVIHIMAGTMQGTNNWFHNPAAKVSAHYGVGRDGTIHQYVHENDSAQHAGKIVRPSWPLLKPGVNPNYYTIGIEHEGTGNETAWPAAQLTASTMLVAQIAARWHIPIDEKHIIRHHEIRADKPCPGEHFDKTKYLAAFPSTPPLQLAGGQQQIHATSRANLRSSPSTASPIVGKLDAGMSFAADGSVTGEQVRGNDKWYRNMNDQYLWAGATDSP